mgnify:CR=1 FL=1
MIEIITGDGTSLDLKPNEEFEVTLEQPLLSEDHIHLISANRKKP